MPDSNSDFYLPAVIANIVFIISMLLSGFDFPIGKMPDVVQWLTYINPLRYYLVIIREFR